MQSALLLCCFHVEIACLPDTTLYVSADHLTLMKGGEIDRGKNNPNHVFKNVPKIFLNHLPAKLRRWLSTT